MGNGSNERADDAEDMHLQVLANNAPALELDHKPGLTRSYRIIITEFFIVDHDWDSRSATALIYCLGRNNQDRSGIINSRTIGLGSNIHLVYNFIGQRKG